MLCLMEAMVDAKTQCWRVGNGEAPKVCCHTSGHSEPPCVSPMPLPETKNRHSELLIPWFLELHFLDDVAPNC
jgi:hypothetical protein